MEKVRKIILFRSYYKEFYVSQTQRVRDKINFVLRLVVLFHGFQKKTQKTPKREILRAENIKKEYLKSKEDRT